MKGTKIDIVQYAENHTTAKVKITVYVLINAGRADVYYFVFVPQNEEHLAEHAKRQLNNKERSAMGKHNGYSK